MIRSIPQAYIWKVISILVVFLSIKLNHLYLEPDTFVPLILAFAIASPVSAMFVWGADLTGQKTVADAGEDDLSNLIASFCFGALPAIIFSLIATKGDVKTVCFVLIIAIYRAIARYYTLVNIQANVASNRAQAGLTISEPILWAIISATLIMLPTGNEATNTLSQAFHVGISASAALVILLFIFPYHPRLTIGHFAKEFTKQTFISKSKLSVSGLLNATFVSLPVIGLTQIGFAADAANFAIAQRYANVILIFEQVRSRLFSANYLKALTQTAQTRQALFNGHVRYALSTGTFMLFALIAGVAIFYHFNFLAELKLNALFYAIIFSALTLCEFGIGTILLITGRGVNYIIANLIAGGLIVAALPFIQNVWIAFAIFIISKLLYVLMLHLYFKQDKRQAL